MPPRALKNRLHPKSSEPRLDLPAADALKEIVDSVFGLLSAGPDQVTELAFCIAAEQVVKLPQEARAEWERVFGAAHALEKPRQKLIFNGIPFTPRQTQVAEELLNGNANRTIASKLRTKENSVKVHIREIMRKTGTTSRSKAVVKLLGISQLAGSASLKPSEQVLTLEAAQGFKIIVDGTIGFLSAPGGLAAPHAFQIVSRAIAELSSDVRVPWEKVFNAARELEHPTPVITLDGKKFGDQQIAILAELAKGLETKEIAGNLGMNEVSLKTHLQKIMRKVGATNRTQVMIAMRRSEWPPMRTKSSRPGAKPPLEAPAC